jgi:hypothetical protein
VDQHHHNTDGHKHVDGGAETATSNSDLIIEE